MWQWFSSVIFCTYNGKRIQSFLKFDWVYLLLIEGPGKHTTLYTHIHIHCLWYCYRFLPYKQKFWKILFYMIFIKKKFAEFRIIKIIYTPLLNILLLWEKLHQLEVILSVLVLSSDAWNNFLQLTFCCCTFWILFHLHYPHIFSVLGELGCVYVVIMYRGCNALWVAQWTNWNLSSNNYSLEKLTTKKIYPTKSKLNVSPAQISQQIPKCPQ